MTLKNLPLQVVGESSDTFQLVLSAIHIPEKGQIHIKYSTELKFTGYIILPSYLEGLFDSFITFFLRIYQRNFLQIIYICLILIKMTMYHLFFTVSLRVLFYLAVLVARRPQFYTQLFEVCKRLSSFLMVHQE